MLDEIVCDASVAVKCMFNEEGSEAALELARRRPLLAPDFVLIELASTSAKKVRRGEAPIEVATRTLVRAPELFAELVPVASLIERSFELAATTRVSIYDGLYLALAEARALSLITADVRLIRAATEAGLANLVQTLA